MNKRINIIDDDRTVNLAQQGDGKIIVSVKPDANIVRVVEKGPKGDRGEPALPISTSSFAITGSNTFVGNQTIEGELSVTDGTNPFFIINTNGYVGLNTSTPSTQLDVVGNAYITGGLALNYGTYTGQDLFIIKSGSFPALRVNSQGLLILGAFSVLPSAQAGAVAYSASGDFFLGF